MTVRYPQPETPWEAEAVYTENGLPANMAAVLHRQWQRMKHRVPA